NHRLLPTKRLLKPLYFLYHQEREIPTNRLPHQLIPTAQYSHQNFYVLLLKDLDCPVQAHRKVVLPANRGSYLVAYSLRSALAVRSAFSRRRWIRIPLPLISAKRRIAPPPLHLQYIDPLPTR